MSPAVRPTVPVWVIELERAADCKRAVLLLALADDPAELACRRMGTGWTYLSSTRTPMARPAGWVAATRGVA